jgi:uncharacterized protein YprB with RNaseH-like and TPR domain
MPLKARLDALRRQSGAVTGPSRGNDLAARLERLGGRARVAAPAGMVRPTDADLAGLLGGERISDGVIRVVRDVPVSCNHGRADLRELLDRRFELPGSGPIDARDCAFIDTETSGLAGGAGTVAFLVGLARLQAQSLRVEQFMMTRFGAEGAMLEAVSEALAAVPVLVSFNGRSFDVPLLRGRYRLTGRSEAFDERQHLDLLHPLRRLFDGHWPDCRLATAESRLLDWRRENDLPGSEAPLAWFDFIRQGRTDRLPAVLQHNHWDLLSLAALLAPVAAAHRQPERWGGRPLAAARAWYRAGDEARARTVLEAAEAAGVLDVEGRVELARLRRRAGNWSGAVELWRALAAAGHEGATESLAKYHEHVERDFAQALECAHRLPAGTAVERRRRRLLARLGGADGEQLRLC